MKQLIHYFWTGPIKKISLKNLAIMQKKRLWCVLSLLHIQSKVTMENVLRIGRLLSHIRRNTYWRRGLFWPPFPSLLRSGESLLRSSWPTTTTTVSPKSCRWQRGAKVEKLETELPPSGSTKLKGFTLPPLWMEKQMKENSKRRSRPSINGLQWR